MIEFLRASDELVGATPALTRTKPRLPRRYIRVNDDRTVWHVASPADTHSLRYDQVSVAIALRRWAAAALRLQRLL